MPALVLHACARDPPPRVRCSGQSWARDAGYRRTTWGIAEGRDSGMCGGAWVGGSEAGSCVMQREVGFGGKRRGVERSGVRGLGIARRLNPTPASTPCRSTAQLRPLRMDNFHRYGGLGRAGCERRQRVVDCRQYDDAVQGSRSPLDSPPLWCPLPSGAGPHVLSVRGSALS